MSRFPSVAVATAATILAAVTPAMSAPTPMPGGADQVTAVAGTVGKPVFNGVLKITLSPVRDATDDEAKIFGADASKKAMSFALLLRNGSHATFNALLSYQLADANGVTSEVPSSNVTHADLTILQGAAQTQKAVFTVDKDFVPTKLVIQCPTCGTHGAFRSIRFALAH